MRPRPGLPLALVLALAACEAPPPAPGGPAAPGRTASTPAAPGGAGSGPSSPQADDVVWVERVPDGAAADARLPMVVGIHGLGDTPESFCHVFDDLRPPVRAVCPRAFSRHGRGWSWFPMDADEATRAAAIGAAADRLAAAIVRLAAARGAPGKPIVTGFSQGGALSFAMAVRHPTALSRALPIGGWLPPALRPAAGAPVAPILALHGEADPRVPIGPTREAIDALVAGGADVSLRVFAGVGHTVPPEVRSALFGAIEQALDAAAAPGQGATP